MLLMKSSLHCIFPILIHIHVLVFCWNLKWYVLPIQWYDFKSKKAMISSQISFDSKNRCALRDCHYIFTEYVIDCFKWSLIKKIIIVAFLLHLYLTYSSSTAHYILLRCVSPRFLGDPHYVIICGVSP